MDNLNEAREWVRHRRSDGCECPCCGLHVKEYRRTITSAMAADLISISRAPKTPSGWVDIKSVRLRGGDYAKLRFWGLLEKSTDALWRVTQGGLEFVNDRAYVPRYAVLFDNDLDRLEGEDVGIRRVLRTLNYEELMTCTVP